MSRTDRPDRDRSAARAVTAAVAALALLSVLARLWGLGARTFHWDEARVGYWTLRFLATGSFEYRPVAGGPFLYVVNRAVFSLLGAGDAAARLVVALIGGALPLAALLFRDRFRPTEIVALALFLGATPLLLYYSRFLRGDVPLAAFALVAVGCVVRYRDRGDDRYLYAGAATLALAVSTSAFAVGYLLCWLVAGTLVLDHRRFAAETDERASDSQPVESGGERARSWHRWLRDEADVVARAVGVYAAVHLFFFAPRAGAGGGPGLWRIETFPAVVESAFLGAAEKFVGVWVISRGTAREGHSLLPYLSHYADLLLLTSLPLVVLAAAAFLADRYGGGPPRTLVAFGAYWAGAALLVFTVITEGREPWVAIHLAVPLALPAAVGGGWLLRTSKHAYAHDRAGSTVAMLLLIVAVVAQGGAAAATVYEQPERSDRIVGYAQPVSDIDPFVTNVSVAIAGNEGTDVLFYGDDLYLNREDAAAQPPVSSAWGDRLPLPWYLERLGAETDSVTSAEELNQSELPPVVVAKATHRAALGRQLGDGYRADTYDLALWDRTFVVFVEK